LVQGLEYDTYRVVRETFSMKYNASNVTGQ